MPDYSQVPGHSDTWPYTRIVQAIEAAIASGELAPGDPLPSEAELGRQTGTSRYAVRHALDVLRERGTVYTRPRLGTFVSRRQAAPGTETGPDGG
jgi:DNA-binding GntR family transcriptional regulator